MQVKELNLDGLEYLAVCDGCGVVAGFRNPNAAMWYAAYRMPETHKQCVAKVKSDDGKKYTVVQIGAQESCAVRGRF